MQMRSGIAAPYTGDTISGNPHGDVRAYDLFGTFQHLPDHQR
jgi:hypothetical protein